MKTAIIGYPYIGKNHDWKAIIEQFCSGILTEKVFYTQLQKLQFNQLAKQQEAGLDVLTIGDFTLYDRMLDLAWMFNLIPKRFRHLSGLSVYYAMACGEEAPCQMNKWFTTNYHYVVPEFDGQMLELVHNPLVEQALQVKAHFKKMPRVTLIGPYTFMRLTTGITKETKQLFTEQLIAVYKELLHSLQVVGVEWVQLEEPALTMDLRKVDVVELQEMYEQLTIGQSLKVMLTTYFEGVERLRDILALPVDGFGLDFVAGYSENMEQLSTLQFPQQKVLAIGLVDGQNIWRTNLAVAIQIVTQLEERCKPQEIWLQSSCHFQHVPITKQGEEQLFWELYDALAFADEKLAELVLIKELTLQQSVVHILKLKENEQQLKRFAEHPSRVCKQVEMELAQIEPQHLKRSASFTRRKRLQQLFLALPNYPTTIVNSFSQSEKIEQLRTLWQCGELTAEQYEHGKKQEIARRILLQEQIGLDVFLYEQVERASMVEFLADQLAGMTLTQRGWVASYGTCCNKPPILYGDVLWKDPMVVQGTQLAQQKTYKPIKCKLTGPTTLLNWSFVRPDLARQQIVMQLALALRKEVKALERAGIYIIQLDEPALVENLPLRKKKQRSYIQSSIEAFKFATAVVRETTQIHAHLYYKDCREFTKIISSIDADVLSIEVGGEASLFFEHLQQKSYKFGIGLGVYEGPPSLAEPKRMTEVLQSRASFIAKEQCWIAPDIGYKKRNEEETVMMLKKVVETVRKMKKFY